MTHHAAVGQHCTEPVKGKAEPVIASDNVIMLTCYGDESGRHTTPTAPHKHEPLRSNPAGGAAVPFAIDQAALPGQCARSRRSGLGPPPAAGRPPIRQSGLWTHRSRVAATYASDGSSELLRAPPGEWAVWHDDNETVRDADNVTWEDPLSFTDPVPEACEPPSAGRPGRDLPLLG